MPSPTAARSSRFDQRQEDILDAARSLINRQGLRDTTLATVAAEIGLNLKSLRYYFKRRDDLVSAVYLRSIALYRRHVEAAMEGRDVEARVRRFIGDCFAMQASVAKGERSHFVQFGDIRAVGAPHSEAVRDAYNQLFRDIRALLSEPSRPVPRRALNAYAHMLLSQMLWSVVWMSGYLPEDHERVSKRFADILFDGVAAKRMETQAFDLPQPARLLSSDALTQESFLRAATASINTQGYRGASVTQISSALNVTKGAFYHHNDNRDEVVVLCFERTFELIRAAQNAALAREMNGLTRAGAAAGALVRSQMAPDGVMLRTAALSAIGPEHRSRMSAQMAIYTTRFADMLSDGVADGSARPCDLRIASEMLTAMINSAEEIGRWVPGVDIDNVTELYVEPLLYGARAGLQA